MAWLEKYETKRGTKYKVRARIGGKKLCFKAGFSKQKAIDIRKEVEARELNETYHLPDPSRKIKELTHEYLEASRKIKKARTVEHIEYGTNKLNEFLGDRGVIGIASMDIQRLRQFLLTKHKVNGVNMIMNAVSACFGYAVKMGYIEKNPAKGSQLKPEKVARFLNKDEVQKLLNLGCKHNPDLKKIVTVALYTGMRRNEILNLRKDRIQNGLIHLEETKTGNPRRIPIHPAIMEYFKKWSIAGWSEDRLGRAFRRAVARAKLGKVRFHDLRHTFCSTYLQSGGTIADLREISGHRSLRSLQVYTHFQPNYLKERIENFRFL